MRHKKSAKPIRIDGMTLVEVSQQGLITRHEDYWDQLKHLSHNSLLAVLSVLSGGESNTSQTKSSRNHAQALGCHTFNIP